MLGSRLDGLYVAMLAGLAPSDAVHTMDLCTVQGGSKVCGTLGPSDTIIGLVRGALSRMLSKLYALLERALRNGISLKGNRLLSALFGSEDPDVRR
jgi:hypothetical protein